MRGSRKANYRKASYDHDQSRLRDALEPAIYFVRRKQSFRTIAMRDAVLSVR